MIWSREIEGGSFATPERRAALEARINELANAVRDEVVRRYYRQDLAERLRRTFAPETGRGGYGRNGYPRAESGRPFPPRRTMQPPRRGGTGPGGVPRFASGPYQAMSPQLANSPVMRGQRSVLSRREALILQFLLNHPWLLHDHLEEVAALDLAHPDAIRLRAGILAAAAHHGPADDEAAERAEVADWLAKNGYSEQIQKVGRVITTAAVWAAQPGAARDDVLATWHQLVALHRQCHSLLRELKDAELALGDEPSEANYKWLQDVKARLAEIDGTEALIEGFGDSSGRPSRTT
jgi:DNA primase